MQCRHNKCNYSRIRINTGLIDNKRYSCQKNNVTCNISCILKDFAGTISNIMMQNISKKIWDFQHYKI